MGNECLGGDRLRNVFDQFVGSLPLLFGCRVGSAEGLQNGIPKGRATGQGVISGRSEVRCPCHPYCLCLLLGICQGEEFNGRFVDGSIHRERQHCRDVVHLELLGSERRGEATKPVTTFARARFGGISLSLCLMRPCDGSKAGYAGPKAFAGW